MGSELPDRDGGTYAVEQKPHQIQALWEAYVRGDLKFRDEMDLEAAEAAVYEAGKPWSVVDDDMQVTDARWGDLVRVAVLAAWGVTDEA